MRLYKVRILFLIVPSRDEIGHGTMIAGIAGGNEVPDSNFYGVAPDAEFVVVKLKPAKKFIRDFFLLQKMQYVFRKTIYFLGLFIYMKCP